MFVPVSVVAVDPCIYFVLSNFWVPQSGIEIIGLDCRPSYGPHVELWMITSNTKYNKICLHPNLTYAFLLTKFNTPLNLHVLIPMPLNTTSKYVMFKLWYR